MNRSQLLARCSAAAAAATIIAGLSAIPAAARPHPGESIVPRFDERNCLLSRIDTQRRHLGRAHGEGEIGGRNDHRVRRVGEWPAGRWSADLDQSQGLAVSKVAVNAIRSSDPVNRSSCTTERSTGSSAPQVRSAPPITASPTGR
jgi:hypothetical protein